MITTREFWLGAFERSFKTFIQVFLASITAVIGQDAIGVSAGFMDVSWLSAVNVAGFAAFYSLVMSMGNADFVAGPDAVARHAASED